MGPSSLQNYVRQVNRLINVTQNVFNLSVLLPKRNTGVSEKGLPPSKDIRKRKREKDPSFMLGFSIIVVSPESSTLDLQL